MIDPSKLTPLPLEVRDHGGIYAVFQGNDWQAARFWNDADAEFFVMARRAFEAFERGIFLRPNYSTGYDGVRRRCGFEAFYQGCQLGTFQGDVFSAIVAAVKYADEWDDDEPKEKPNA